MNTKEQVNRAMLEKEVLEQEKAEISEYSNTRSHDHTLCIYLYINNNNNNNNFLCANILENQYAHFVVSLMEYPVYFFLCSFVIP